MNLGKLRLAFLLFTLCSISHLNAQNILSYQVEKNTLQLLTDDGFIFIESYTADIIRISGISEQKVENTDAIYLQPKLVKVNITDLENGLLYKTDSLCLHIGFNPFFIQFYNAKNEYLSQITQLKDKNETCGFDLKLDDREMIFGLGERAISMNRRGYRLNLNNEGHWGYGWGEENLNFSIPHFISSENYSIFLDNGGIGTADVGQAIDSLLQVEVAANNFNLFFISNSSQKQLQQRFSKLTGTQAMPPRWAFGNFMSRFSYETEFETRNKLDSMIAAGYPVDAIIIDLYWFGKGRKDWMMGELDWYKPTWPNPAKMISDFKEKGVQTILITEPYVLETSSNYQSGISNNAFAKNLLGEEKIIDDFFFGKAGLIDLFSTEGKDWFWKFYQKQADIGVAGWWGDLGEPERFHDDLQFSIGKGTHFKNLYGHYWSKMVAENYNKHFPNERLFHLNRAGFAGSQRYSSFPWSGDVSRTWGGLKAQPSILMSMNLSGVPYIHSDLGGFCAADKNEELYLRWLQYGVFNPIFRPHSENVPSEAMFYSDSIQEYLKPFFALRYQLLPYLYTNAWKQQYFAEPLATPLFVKNSVPKTLMDITNQYMWGDAFMVAPVLESGIKSQTVFLPIGVWFNFFTDRRYFGNSFIEETVSFDQIPVFVKAGSFIPMTQAMQSTAFYQPDTLDIHFYYDRSVKQSSTSIYDDDGEMKNAYSKQQFELIKIEFSATNNQLKFNFTNEGFDYTGRVDERLIRLILHNFKDVESKNTFEITLPKNTKKELIIRQ